MNEGVVDMELKSEVAWLQKDDGVGGLAEMRGLFFSLHLYLSIWAEMTVTALLSLQFQGKGLTTILGPFFNQVTLACLQIV